MLDPSITIRQAGLHDLDAMVALWGDMMRDHQARDGRVRLTDGALNSYRAYLAYHLPNSDSCVGVADACGEVIGFCLLSISRNLPMFEPARYGYLSDLTVDAPWRRQGVGRALLERGRAWLGERGIDTVQLQFYSHNDVGEAFWRAMGFEPFYTRMWCNL